MKNLLMYCFAFINLLGFNVYAQEELPEKTISPYFFVKSNDKTDQMPLKSTSAEVNVAGVIADVKITQVYVNEGKNTLEAIYIFPASVRAAVYGMTMTIGERKIVARIEEKNKAREQYETAKEQGKTASLLEQERPNVFQMNVANILPNDKIIVELHYTELLIPTNGVYEFVYPTVVGPRYSTSTTASQNPDDKWVANPYLHEGEKPNYIFDLKTRINAGLPIQDITCNTHQIDINYKDKNTGFVQLKSSEKDGGNKDFILKYRLAGDVIQSGILLYEGEGLTASADTDIKEDEKFFLMMMQPPKTPNNEQIPPREYVFIVDVSGSMNGFPLDISKSVLRNLISNLRPTDKFNVMLFESSNQMLSPESMNATQDNIKKAIDVIDNQRGSGGTNLLPALKNALAFKETANFSRTFIVVTDGYITVEKEAFDLIRNSLNTANLFAFGIGSSVNRLLIDGMARAGLGEPFVITKQSEAATVGEKFRNYIQNPVLTNIKVKYNGFEVYDIEPVSIPDVFAERPIIIYGKYRGAAQGTVTLEGLSGTQNYTYTLNLSDAQKENNQAVKYLWARNKIAVLGDFTKLYPYDADHQKKITEITQMGLKYNLLTDYTSFIAVDEEIRNKEGKSNTVIQALPLPEGVSDNAVGKTNTALSPNKNYYKGGGVSGKEKKAMTITGSQERGISNVDEKDLESEEEIDEMIVEEVVVSPSVPEFIGGKEALEKLIAQNLKYPKKALEKRITGMVTVEFTVNEDGTLSDFKIINGLGEGCDEEAIRVLKLSPNWRPAYSNGKAIKSKVVHAVRFKLK